jgi:hypothetical protein
MEREVVEAVEGTPAKDLPEKDEAVKAEAEVTTEARVKRENFILEPFLSNKRKYESSGKIEDRMSNVADEGAKNKANPWLRQLYGHQHVHIRVQLDSTSTTIEWSHGLNAESVSREARRLLETA